MDFFKSKEHTHLPSASLIPVGDPTLLFTTAGMVQFKPYFAGTEEPVNKRVVTIQKCIRTTDLESVGKTQRHLTMFEMLGNFSFYNAYFKKEAIQYSWEFSLKHLQFPPEKIFITVYEDDDEAEEIWNKEIGVPMERITRLGKKDNWWGPAGDSGPCGPCSELYLDRGEEFCTCEDKSECTVGGECDRFMEYWNIVFNQFHQDQAGELHPLPQKGIDTGAGLERIVTLLYGTDSVYDTDELTKIIQEIEKLLPELREDGQTVTYDENTATPFRVITDHSRSVSFAIADGILPDNTGRGYVIRRIIRRGLLFARELGVHQPILHRLVPLILEIYGPFYPELQKKGDDIARRIKSEEERFLNTLDQGLKIWEIYLQDHMDKKETIFRGEEAFRLYDTFGFPLEMTVELAEKAGLEVDLARFEELMEKQRKAASEAAAWKDFTFPTDFPLPLNSVTEFIGYDRTTGEGKVLAILSEDQPRTEIGELTPAIIILDRTPFYGESGGQQGDTGRLTLNNGEVFIVRDTQKKGDLILHAGELMTGKLRVGDVLKAEIDTGRRDDLTRHHSATHLLNAALRKYLGDHVMQTGSLVAPNYLRFDFSHSEKISDSVLHEVEKEVNRSILNQGKVNANVMPIDDARKTGAVAAFGEKYGENVRVVSMGDQGGLSTEFCGGCHVQNTEDIQFFHIVREGSPGAGNRRIEALAGEHVVAFFQNDADEIAARIMDLNQRIAGDAEDDEKEKSTLIMHQELPTRSEISDLLHNHEVSTIELTDRFNEIRQKIALAEKEFARFKKKKASGKTDALMEQLDVFEESAKEISSSRVFIHTFQSEDIKNLRQVGDALKEKHRNAVILFGVNTEKGPVLLFMANKDAVNAGADCGKLIKEAAGILGGGGGGRPDMAQAGGKDGSRLDEALEKATAILETQLK